MSNPIPLPLPDPQVVSRRMGDAWVLVHLDSGEVYEINATLGSLWSLLRQKISRDEIVARLLDEFDSERETVEREIDMGLEMLQRKGLVTGLDRRK